ncbi:hypothetical protein H2201_007636 [Coniosporium apollinis]|uniref:Uncharacterized protein n=1 Tax=Coniosporium apollinis TaxID=61459 RepID=A0ABQ9NNV8_9PEZI|nr:hypothetical protein H2201_007636 [Coniosporium apollinis]
MLMPSTRRVALLSLVTFLILLLVIRRSAYEDHISYHHTPDFYHPDAGQVEQPSAAPLAGKPPALDIEDEPWDHQPSTTEDYEHSGTPTTGPKVPTRWLASPDDQPSDNSEQASETTPLPQATNVKQYLQAVLKWTRPKQEDGHWPKYGYYEDRDYDPNRWETFPVEEGFYTDSGIQLLDKSASTYPEPYTPIPDYNSAEWQQQWKGEYQSCEGPRGLPLNESSQDIIHAYRGPPAGFPEPSAGSFEAIGIHDNVCFDRYSRYGPYGFLNKDVDVSGWTTPEKLYWRGVKWGELQNQCLERNQNRYAEHARSAPDTNPGMGLPEEASASDAPKGLIRPKETRTAASPSYRSRTAILIRSWEGYTYTDNDLQAIRALIIETSLLSGGEYQVFLFLNVKDENAHIYSDEKTYNDFVKRVVPAELCSITILWSEEMCKKWYPDITDWQVYWHQWMPVQWFSETHPEFDYIVNWETDARYTGHHYEFLESIADFARKQPRKFLWERNKRFYLPAVHGSYEQFFEDTNAIVANASASSQITPVWGPQPYLPVQTPLGPEPPTTQDADNFSWGVSEEADLITLLPIWDPRNTSWSMKDKIWNFVPDFLNTGRTRHPIFTPSQPTHDSFTDPRFVDIDRRVFINTVARFSRKLLHAMHVENRAGRTMQAEMWPATVALHHGLKAVFAPHPVYFDRRWPGEYADLVFNPRGETSVSPAPELSSSSDVDPRVLANDGGGDDGFATAWGERQDSPYNHDREYNFWGWSWYYKSRFGGRLYRRWLGWKVVVHPFGYKGQEVGGEEWEKEHGGRMCLPPMLLHPVKGMKEGEVWDEWVVQ